MNENSCCFIVRPRLYTVDNDLRTEQNNYGQTSSSHSDSTKIIRKWCEIKTEFFSVRKLHCLSSIWGLLKLSVKVKTDLLILSITSTFKMILPDRGLDRRIQEMGLGNNISKEFSRGKAMKVEHNRV